MPEQHLPVRIVRRAFPLQAAAVAKAGQSRGDFPNLLFAPKIPSLPFFQMEFLE
jgi:hypothetical protein